MPHSGMTLTEEAKRNLLPEPNKRLPNMDWHLRELYDFLKEFPVSVISTDISRYIVDLNRAPISTLFGDFRHSLVYQMNTWGEEIYRTFPSEEELKQRIEQYYKPYHQALDDLVASAIEQFGHAVVIDLHSFMGPVESDICLGNLDNESTSVALLETLYNAFSESGFDTTKNNFYKGGYITAKYCDHPKVQSIQIELRYTNYLLSEDYDSRRPPRVDEAKLHAVRARLSALLIRLFAFLKDSKTIRALLFRSPP